MANKLDLLMPWYLKDLTVNYNENKNYPLKPLEQTLHGGIGQIYAMCEVICGLVDLY